MLSTAARRALGIGAIAAGVLAVVLILSPPSPFADRYRYWAVFDTAQGLGPIDRDIRVAGLKVGEIGAVERVGDDVRAELVLHEDIPMHDDARAEMRPHTLFEGSNFVDLEPGSPSAPRLEEGGEIPIEQTDTYVTFDEALRVLRPQIREGLRDLARSGSRTLRGEAVAGVQRTLRAAPRLNRALAPAARAAQGPGRRELAGAISGIAATVDAVAAKEEELVPLAQRMSRTAAALTVDGGAPLDGALAALPGALRELRDSAPALTAIVERLDRLSVEATPALPELALALREIAPVLERSTPVLRRATPLVRDARLIATRLGRARGGLVRMFGLLEGPLELGPEVFELVNEPSEHGAPNYRQLVAGAFTGADAAFRSYQTRAQDPLAPGHVFRIGQYFNPEALGGGVPDLFGGGLPRSEQVREPWSAWCGDIVPISPRAARQLRAWGGCR